MMRAIRTFFRHIRDGFRNLFRNGWMTLASIITMTITLTIVGCFIFLVANVTKITQTIESTIQIKVAIQLDATPEEEAKLKADIEKVQHVTKATYRTRDEELALLKETYGDVFDGLEGDKNQLFNVYMVDVDAPENLRAVNDALAQLPKVQESSYGEFDTESILRMINTTQTVVGVVAAVFVFGAVLLVSNTIRLTIFARQTEIEIMRLVGATRRYVRAPFAYEGGYIGLISAVLACGGIYGLYELAQRGLPQAVGLNSLNMVPTFPLLFWIGGGILILGIILGNVGARRSIRRFLDY